MNSDFSFVIGLMSGTSLDGIDLTHVQFDKNDYSNFNIIHAETIPYPLKWKEKLKNAIDFSADDLKELDLEYGKFLGEKVNTFIIEKNITKIDFIASHGHTVLHQPDKGVTLQIGNGKVIANATGQKVICDFRTQDVKLGGQGAPLVPIGDQLLFKEYDFCINLGGFANVSYERNGERIAFDICPVNIVLNHYVQKLNREYDDRGKIAERGKINENLLDALNRLSFYKKNPPKSLGLEWVQQEVFPLIDSCEKNIPNILKTVVEHAAFQIGKIIKNSSSILITGGGVFNDYLIRRIEFYSEEQLKIPSKELINYKEALVFAFLGLLKSDNQVNCLKTVTGASRNHSSGVIFYP